MTEKSFTYNDYGLDALLQAISGQLPRAKVGVLGDNTKRKKGEKTNAEIGLKHEFGEDGMPVRSFLRVPLIENLQKYVNKSKAYDESTLIKVIDDGKITEWVRALGIIGELVVADAFKTGGFGKWPASYMRYKKVHQTLVETTQLRDSIISEVIDD